MTPAVRYIIYLLHFDQVVSGKRHYLGITRYERLERRMRTHQIGLGASLTRRVHKAAVGFTAHVIATTEDPRLEQRLKRRGHFATICPQCSQSPDEPDMFFQCSHYPPVDQAPQSTLVSWP